ncbi:MAG: Gfo/Idh/MocA family oxidoreductase [Synergistetes bacterium]|nr:Gfo/Idh/MocA family oxidoreductase [Synergistota bacterium]
MKRVRTAVIGVGYLGKHHARIYSELEASELVAVVDIIGKRAEEIARRYSCSAYKDYRDMLEKEEIDAVSVAVPTTSHYQIARDCLSRGINVLVEKPIATSLWQADELFKISEERGVVFQVGYVERFNPIVSFLPRYVSSPLLILAKRLCPFANRNLDVGVVLDLMVHDIDIVLSLLGDSAEIEEISGAGASIVSPHEDIASAYVRFKGGCVAHFIVSRVSPMSSRKLEIVERDRKIVLDYRSKEIFVYGLNGFSSIEHLKLVSVEEPLKRELSSFINNVISRRNPRGDGRTSLQIALEILDSMRENGYV